MVPKEPDEVYIDNMNNNNNKKSNIYLIGFMGSGKSTVASKLSEEYGYNIVEMDQAIVEKEGMSINEIFAKNGEEYFRQTETGLLKEISGMENMVVSCGGGVATRDENIRLMKESGKVFLLSAEPETIYERVKDDDSRPLLRGNMNIPYIAEMIEKRRPMYERAADVTISVDGKEITEICREVRSHIQ